MSASPPSPVGAAGPAAWPAPPEQWSYSRLREVELCPRSWSLSHAAYPEVWDRPGYPPRSSVPSLIGDVVHGAVEDVLRALYAGGDEADADVAGVGVLRRLGGYTAVVERRIEQRVEQLRANPRMAGQVDRIRAELRQKTPEIRLRVQGLIARIAPTAARKEARPRGSGARSALKPGSYPEVDLRAPDLRFVGRVDLLSVAEDEVAITDYKTGQPDPHHADQLRIYALLWHRDHELNPRATRATKLTIAYASHDEPFDGPDEETLAELATGLTSRLTDAEANLRLNPPPAMPAAETCRLCPVRHLCDEYWAGLPARGDSESPGSSTPYLDCQGEVISRNGPRSWTMQLEPTRQKVLLRTPLESAPFAAGDHVRLLGVRLNEDDDGEQTIVTITQASEVFVVVT